MLAVGLLYNQAKLIESLLTGESEKEASSSYSFTKILDTKQSKESEKIEKNLRTRLGDEDFNIKLEKKEDIEFLPLAIPHFESTVEITDDLLNRSPLLVQKSPRIFQFTSNDSPTNNFDETNKPDENVWLSNQRKQAEIRGTGNGKRRGKDELVEQKNGEETDCMYDLPELSIVDLVGYVPVVNKGKMTLKPRSRSPGTEIATFEMPSSLKLGQNRKTSVGEHLKQSNNLTQILRSNKPEMNGGRLMQRTNNQTRSKVTEERPIENPIEVPSFSRSNIQASSIPKNYFLSTIPDDPSIQRSVQNRRPESHNSNKIQNSRSFDGNRHLSKPYGLKTKTLNNTTIGEPSLPHRANPSPKKDKVSRKKIGSGMKKSASNFDDNSVHHPRYIDMMVRMKYQPSK